MVRRRLLSGAAALRSLMKSARQLPSTITSFTSPSPAPSLKYIDERVNNVFNIILAEINQKNRTPSLGSQHSSLPIYKDPYKFKDSILQDLVANSDITTNYNIHELIEEEFQLEISDQEFEQFKSLSDIVKYVNGRLQLRHSMRLYDSGNFNSNLTY